MTDWLFQAKGLNKSFAVPVLKNFDFGLAYGEIHALMGSNGAGKSTFSNLVSGVLTPDSGEMLLEGVRHSPSSIKEGEQAGVQMVMQELNLFDTLSIAENVCFKSLGNGFGVLDHQALKERTRNALENLGLDELSPDKRVSELGVGQKQLVEIASVLIRPCKMLILDEPTAALTGPQIEVLFEQLRALKAQGVGVMYISHRMDDIFAIADRISVLRDGERVVTQEADELTEAELVGLMAGGNTNGNRVSSGIPPSSFAPPSAKQPDSVLSPVVLKVDKLGRKGAFTDISFELRAGEVLGFGGLIGSGRTELLRAIFGADIADAGGVALKQDQFATVHRFKSPSEAVSKGIGMVVEDRKAQGLLLEADISSNTSLAVLSGLTRALGVVDRQRELSLVSQSADNLNVRHSGLNRPVKLLSGGNQQKVLINRWLLRDLDILMFDEPGRGVDASAKALIYERIKEEAQRGKAIIVVSSDTRELLALATRVMVLSNGRLAGEFDPKKLTERMLLEASFMFYTQNPVAPGSVA